METGPREVWGCPRHTYRDELLHRVADVQHVLSTARIQQQNGAHPLLLMTIHRPRQASACPLLSWTAPRRPQEGRRRASAGLIMKPHLLPLRCRPPGALRGTSCTPEHKGLGLPKPAPLAKRVPQLGDPEHPTQAPGHGGQRLAQRFPDVGSPPSSLRAGTGVSSPCPPHALPAPGRTRSAAQQWGHRWNLEWPLRLHRGPSQLRAVGLPASALGAPCWRSPRHHKTRHHKTRGPGRPAATLAPEAAMSAGLAAADGIPTKEPRLPGQDSPHSLPTLCWRPPHSP
ncbi:uncharacterized protein LOC118675360 [Myotis myotis]|uniref:uncharacterized protein LOC118675360 n=1 Tax=Myotis myotis TaxID=51298 RepID=UPI001748F7F9|nr:uncharacterized protein LOC118675360 [Myotis myotis]